MSVEEYWTGKEVNYDKIWHEYLAGKDGYIKKFRSSEYYLMQLEFDFPDLDLPLVNFDVIEKTIKGCYHDLKKQYFPEEYEKLGPLFLYKVERGSGIFEFLGQFSQLIVLSIWLVPGIKNEIIEILREHKKGLQIKNQIEKINLIDSIKDSKIPEQVKTNLINEGLSSLKIDLQAPFDGTIENSRKRLETLMENKNKGMKGKS